MKNLFKIPNSGAAPSASVGVLRDLSRIDPGLRVAWSSYFLDQTQHPPVPLKDKHGELIHHPRWHVFMLRGGRYHHLFDTESLDGRVPKKILGDLGRHFTPKQLSELMKEAQKKKYEDRTRKFEELRQDEIKANKGAISAAMEKLSDGEQGGKAMRDKTIYSYDGQGNSRGTSHNTIPATFKEVGWEKPDYEEIQ